MRSLDCGEIQHSGATFRDVLKSSWMRFILVIGFSLLYFTETCIRASEKTFWFDELCTLYICRLPTFKAAWAAVLHGVDYNPPLFYILQRLGRTLFGEGQITMRIPAMLGFWVLCLCLFRFVTKRAGPVAGWIAMALPMLTGAYFYAYEARPHGIVLGFCGAALVCWDSAEDGGRWKTWWLAGFAACLGGAFLTHCYAVVIAIPFALVELVRSVRFRVFRPGRWLAMAVPGGVAVVSFLPLLHSFQANVAVTNFNAIFAPDWSQARAFYAYLLGPCILILLCALAFFGLRVPALLRRAPFDEAEPRTTVFDAVLIAGFLALPVYGIVLAKIADGPFFARYFMAAVTGVALLIALPARVTQRKAWSALALAVIVAAALVCRTSSVIWDRYHMQGEPLVEPSTGLLMNTAVWKPLEKHSFLVANAGGSLPIVVAYQLDFLYLVHYWPEKVARLYSVTGARDELQYRLYGVIRKWCGVDYNPPQIFDDFLPLHHDFLLYGNVEYQPMITDLMRKGVELKSLRFGDRDHYLAVMHVPDRAPASH